MTKYLSRITKGYQSAKLNQISFLLGLILLTLSHYGSAQLRDATLESEQTLPLAQPDALTWRVGGSKIYMASRDVIYQYSTSSYLSSSQSFSSEASLDMFDESVDLDYITGMAFNNDGTALYVIGSGGNDEGYINRFNLSTAWDVSTASLSTISRRQVLSGPQDIKFNDDGTKLFLLTSNGRIYEYELTSPYYISSSTPAYTNLFYVPNESTPTGFTFNANGSRLYVVGSGSDHVREYYLPEPYNLSSYETEDVFYVGAQDGTPQAIGFDNDDDELYILGRGNRKIYQYSMNAYPVVTRIYPTSSESDRSSVSFRVNFSEGIVGFGISDLVFNRSGDISWENITVSPGGTDTYKYVELTGLSGTGILTLAINPGNRFEDFNGLSNSGGFTKCEPYVVGSAYNTTEARYRSSFDLSTLIPNETTVTDINFNQDNSKMYVVGNGQGKIYEFDLSTPGDISTAQYLGDTEALDLSSWSSSPVQFQFAENGTKLFLQDLNMDGLTVFNLSTAYDVSTAFLDAFYEFTTINTSRGFDFSDDGLKLLVVGSNDVFHEFVLNTAYDLSSITDTGNSYDFGDEENNPTDIQLVKGGRILLLQGKERDGISVYHLPTANSLIGAELLPENTFLSTTTQSRTMEGMGFSSDGSWMYSISNTETIYAFELNTAPRVTKFTASANNAPGASEGTIDLVFSERVEGVTKEDFEVYPIGEGVIGYISDVIGENENYTLNMAGINGSGALRVSFKENAEVKGVDGLSLTPFTDPAYYLIGENFNFIDPLESGRFDLDDWDTSPSSMAFSANGTKMFVVGRSNDLVHTFSLSTPWDVTSASYVTGATLDVSDVEGSVNSMLMNPDGTRLFVVGVNSTIHEYHLSTGFDLTTAVYAGIDEALNGVYNTTIEFSNDGMKLFALGSNRVYKYDLTAPYDVSTGVVDDYYLNVNGGRETSTTSITFDNTGHRLFVTGTRSRNINVYFMTSPYDLTTAEYGDAEIAFSPGITPYDIQFDANGGRLYVIESSDYVYQYDLNSSPEVVSFRRTIYQNVSPIFDIVFSEGVTGVDKDDFEFVTSDGVADHSNHSFFSFQQYTKNHYRIYPAAFEYTGDGTFYYRLKDSGTDIVDVDGNPLIGGASSDIVSVGGGFDATDAAYLGASKSYTIAEESSVQAFTFNNDGSKMYATGYSSDDVHEYDLSSPFDVSSAVFSQTLDINGKVVNPNGIKFNNDGTRMYLISPSSDVISEYRLTTAFDISSAIYQGIDDVFSVRDQETSPTSFVFNQDGYYLYVIGSSGDDVNTYQLTTAFDISTAIDLGASGNFNMSTEDSSPESIFFNPDGTRLLMIGGTNKKIFEYNLEVPYDFSTCTYAGSEQDFDLSATVTSPEDMSFNQDGTLLYVLDSDNGTIHTFDLNTAPEIEKFFPYPLPANSNWATFHLFFDEPVSGLDVSDFELITDGTTAEIQNMHLWNDYSGYVNIKNIEGQGSIKLKLKATGSGIVDLVGKSFPEDAITEAHIVDRVGPSATVSIQQTALKIGETTNVTFNFSEEVVGFDLTDITVPGGTLSELSTTDNIIFTSTFTPVADFVESNLQIELLIDGVEDTIQNVGVANALSNTYAVDTKRPDLMISLDDEEFKTGETAVITFAFSEVVNGFDLTDVTAENGSLTDLTTDDGGMTFTATFTPDAQVESAANVISIDKSAVTDQAGNTGEGIASSANYVIDTQVPSYTISIDDQSLIAGETATITVTFTEPVFGLVDNATIQVNAPNGTVSGLTLSEGVESLAVTFTPDQDIEIASNEVTFSATGIVDVKSNPLVTSTEITSEVYAIDTKLPSVDIAIDDLKLLVGETANVTLTFSEPVVDFADDDLSIDNGTLSALTTEDRGLTFTAVLTPSVGFEAEDNFITVDNTAYTDQAGNAGLSSTSSAAYAIDTELPVLAITIQDDLLGVDESTLVTFTFSEDVDGFGLEDITTPNGSIDGLNATTGTRVYQATYTPDAFIEDYENVFSVDNTGYTDIQGNAGTGTTESYNYIVDGVIPTAEITLSDDVLTIGETNEVTITFSEPVLDFTNEDFRNISFGMLSEVLTFDGGLIYTAIFTPSQETESRHEDLDPLIIENALFSDEAGNPGVGSTFKFFVIDTKSPTVEITFDDDKLLVGESTNLTITFSESVTDFDATDIIVENGMISDFQYFSKGTEKYTAVFTPNENVQDLTNVFSIEAGAFTDASGNPSLASVSDNFVIDVVRPTADLMIDQADLMVGETATLTITFNEEVTDFDVTDLSIESGSFSEVTTQDGITYTTTLTPDVDVEVNDVDITLNLPGVTDMQGNAGESAVLFGPLNFDTTIPTATLTLSQNTLIAGETAQATVVFSEEVADFNEGDIAFVGGRLVDYFTDDNTTFTATFIPTPDLEMAEAGITVDLAGVVDLAGNAGSGILESENISIDTKRPTVVLVMDDVKLLEGESANLTFTFSEEVTGFELSDIGYRYGELTSFQTTDNTVFTVVFTPAVDNASENNKIGMSSQSFTDLSGNTGEDDAVVYFEINTVIPVITFEEPADYTYGDAAFELVATSSNSQQVFFTSSDESILSISNQTATLQSAGAVTISAIQPATEDENEAEPVSYTLEIAKAALTISANDQSKVYGESNPELTMAFDGLVNGDDESVLTLPAISTTATIESEIGTYAITLEGGVSDDYEITLVGAEMTITPAMLTATANSYSRNYGTANPELDITYSGFVNADDESSITEPAISTEVNELTGVGIYDISLTGGDAENYELTLVNGQLTIEQTTLTITADDQMRIYGEENPAFTLTYSGFVNGENETVLDQVPIASTVATQDSNAGTYEIAVAGGEGDNYDLTYETGTLTIQKADQAISFEALEDKIYGDAPISLDASATSELAISFSAEGPVALSGNEVTITGAGEVTITASQAGNENFNAAQSVSQTFTIAKAALTATADDASSIFGEAIPELTVSYTGFVNGDDESVLDQAPTATTLATATSDAGTYEITAADGSDDNYELSYQSGTLTIGTADQRITFDALEDKIYGDAPVALAATTTSGLDISYSAEGPVTLSGNEVTITGIGQVTITASQTGDNNYNPAEAVSQSFSISKAQLTAIAVDASSTFGEAIPELTVEYSGFVYDETAEVIDQAPTASTTATSSSDAGEYDITVANGSDDHYEFNYTSGTLTINKADQTITFDPISDVDLLNTNEVNLVATASSGLALTLELVTGNGVINGTVLTVNETGTFEVKAIQAGNLNYNAGSTTVIFNVTDSRKSDQTISFSALEDKVYGDAPFALNATATSELAVAYAVEGPVSITGNQVTITGAGEVIITATQTGNDGFNPAPTVSQSFTVSKAMLMATAENATMIFGGEVPTLAVNYTGFVNGEDETVLDQLATANTTATSASDAGTYAITADGALDINYAFTYAEGTLTIEKANQSITLDDIADFDLLNANEVTVTASTSSGLEVSLELIAGDGALDGNTLTVNSSGTFTIQATQSGNENYNAAPAVTVTFNVTDSRKSDQTITFDALTDKTYGDAPFGLTATATSGLDVVYQVDGPATLAGSEVTISGAGEVKVTASQSGNDSFNPAQTVTQTFTVSKASLTATADDATMVYGGDLPGLTVSHTGFVNGDDETVLDQLATANTTATSASNAGTYAITVDGGSDDNYAFTYAEGTLTIEKADQDITFEAIADVDLADQNSVALSAVASSGLAVSYELVSGDGSISGNTLTLNSTGSFTVQAAQAGSINYLAATASQTFNVTDSRKSDQTITFDVLTDKTYGDAPFGLTATATSGLDVVFQIDGLATIAGSEVTITGAGEVKVTASQSGNDSFNPAQTVTQTFTVSKASLTAKADDATMVYGGDLPGFTVSYTGFVNGDEETVLDQLATANTTATSASDAGTYAITVDGGSDDNYAFTYAEGTLTIEKADQDITFEAIADVDLADQNSVALSAEASSGLEVSYELVSGDGAIDGTILTINAVGTFEVMASQPGNNNYNAATAVTQVFVVTDSRKADQAITFELPQSAYVSDEMVSLQATSDAGLDVTFEIVAGSEFATITGNQLMLLAAGTVVVNAFNEGNADFNPASTMATIEILPVFSLSGLVTDENGNTFTAGKARLTSSGETNGQQVDLSAEGGYTFTDLKQGTYFVTITPNDPAAYLGTAFGNVNTFQNATPINLFSDSTGFDIQMIARPSENLLDGDGVVTGRVIESDDNSSRIEKGRILEGQPIANVSVLLIRKADDQLMTEVFTDENGDFSIEGIPYGDFSLVINMPGIAGGISSDINIVAGQELLMTAMVGKEGVVFETTKSILGTDYSELKIYPNPTQNAFVLDGAQDLKVQLFDQYGNTVLTTQSNRVTDISDLADGMYFLNILDENGRLISTKKLIKKSR